MKQSSSSKKYQALISDLDGTLILNTPTSLPSKNVIKAIKKASKFIHIGIATSRPFKHAEKIINILNLTSPCIVGGGSQIVDPITKKVLWEKRLANEELRTVLKLLKEQNTNTGIIDDRGNFINNFRYKEPPLQIWVQAVSSEKADEIIKKVSKIKTISINTVPSYTKGKKALIITDIHATKQHAILKVARLLKIDTTSIIGIGDGGNDFPLLMACGLKVAMGNADKDLKEIADYIAPPVEEDGVVDVIERFILNEK